MVTTDRRMMNYAISLLESDLEDLYNMKIYLERDEKGIVEVTVNGEQSCRMVTADAIEWVKERITQVKRGIKYWESAKEGR